MAPLGRKTALTFLLLLPAALGAQARGLPLIHSGLAARGGMALDVGFGNDAAGTGTTIGATATAGAGFIGVSATVACGSANDNAVWSQAVAISMRLLGGPVMPFRVTLQAGAGRWNQGIVETVRLPVSLGLAAVIPIPGVAIRPWLAPRIDYQSTTFENSDISSTEFGLSGGIELGLLNGVTIRSAYDRLFTTGRPGIFSVGVGLSLGR